MVALIPNTMDPDQTALLGAVWSEFIVFAYVVKVFRSEFDFMQK